MNIKKRFSIFAELPVIAILRNIRPDECLEICDALYKAGIRVVEVPLNSPSAYESIRRMSQKFTDNIVIGAGTVLTVGQARQVFDCGGSIIVSPNCDEKVVSAGIKNNMVVMPGCFTPSEIFQAVDMGVKKIKIFPAEALGYAYIQSVKSVLPKGISLYAVGGIDANNVFEWLDAGVEGVGVGSSIFKPGDTPEQVFKRACEIVEMVKKYKTK